MAYGRLQPFSRFPATAGTTYPKFYDPGSGSGTRRMLGLGVAGSLAADATWELHWAAPVTIPTGTLKLELWGLANATSGSAKVNPKWDGVAMGANPGAATLNAEGTSTITWTTAHIVVQTKITLDATTLLASEILSMNLVFETSGWTLTAESVWVPWIVWE